MENKDPNKNLDPVIHVMPEKFLTGQSKKQKNTQVNISGQSVGSAKGGHKKTIFLIIAIVVVVVIILGGVGAYLFLQMQNNNQQPVPSNANQVVVNKNTNVNQNTNQEVNDNLNALANENANDNLNQDQENINGQENVNIEVNDNLNTSLNLNLNKQVQQSKDSDDDLLTDVEESIYQTEVSKPDSDSDGYIDGQEMLAGYNPLGSGKLAKAKEMFSTYQNDVFSYEILYPYQWTADPLDQEERTVLLTSDTGEFVEVTVSENTDKLSIKEWYQELYPEISSEKLTSVKTLDGGLLGVQSMQGYTVYFGDDDYVYAINYNFGTETRINFYTTFQIMYSNFKLIEATEEVETNINDNSNINTETNSNVNENTNTELETNVNTNVNSNSNDNSNTNSNLNSNLNAN